MLDSNPKRVQVVRPYLKFFKIVVRSIEALSQSIELKIFSILLSAACMFLNLDLYQLEQCLKHFINPKI